MALLMGNLLYLYDENVCMFVFIKTRPYLINLDWLTCNFVLTCRNIVAVKNTCQENALIWLLLILNYTI